MTDDTIALFSFPAVEDKKVAAAFERRFGGVGANRKSLPRLWAA
jgi:hypothetical protein